MFKKSLVLLFLLGVWLVWWPAAQVQKNEKPLFEARKPAKNRLRGGGSDVTLKSWEGLGQFGGLFCQAHLPPNPVSGDACLNLSSPDGKTFCSAGFVGKNILLIASHCLCTNPLDTDKYVKQMNDFYRVNNVYFHPGKYCKPSSSSPQEHVRDIAVLTTSKLNQKVSKVSVYWGNKPTEDLNLGEGVFGVGFGGFEYVPGGSSVNDIPSTGKIDAELLDFSAVIFMSQNTKASPFHGDSGGPIFAHDNQGNLRQIAVTSGFFSPGDGIFAPTYDSTKFDPDLEDFYTPNGMFLKDIFSKIDPDGDGISSDLDNCPDDPNENQQDLDGDGVGDACDNCPGLVCKGIWGDPSRCKNADQNDFDQDGLGDVCDLCPELSGAGQGDQDGDFIGDACDFCPGFADPLQSCNSDEDCKLPDGKPHICIGQSNTKRRCSAQVQPDLDGDGVGDKCDNCPELKNKGNQQDSDGDGVGDACDNCDQPNPFANCAFGGSCVDAQGKNHLCLKGTDGSAYCSAQLDDKDGDGVGDACDNCDTVADETVQVNSNDLAELREQIYVGQAAPPKNDACDPVPVLNSSQLGSYDKTDGVSFTPLLPGTGIDTDAVFASSAALGEGAGVAGVPTNTASRSVGFRHCSCIDDGFILNKKDCWANHCPQNVEQFSFSDNNPDLGWQKVTVGRYTASKQELNKPALDPTFNLTYANEIDCESDAWLHANGSGSPCRFGRVSLLRWNFLKDVNRPANGFPRPVQYLGTKNTTVGLFWSHTLRKNALDSLSERDASSTGRLRDNYEYTRTPSGYPVQIQVPTDEAIPCKFSGCYMVFRRDWLLEGSLLPKDILMSVARSSLLVPTEAGRIQAVQQDRVDAVDVTSGFSENSRNEYLAGKISWMSSVDRGLPGRARPGYASAVGLPEALNPGTTPLLPVRVNNGELSFGGRQVDVEDHSVLLTAKTAAPASSPGSYIGAFSGLEQNAYVVEKASGAVWEYNLPTQQWRSLFSSSAIQATNVLAVTYDTDSGKLLILDEKGGKWLKSVHLWVMNTRTGAVKQVLNLPRVGLFDSFGMVPQGDGFWLVAGNEQHWKVFSFKLSEQDNLSWTGLGGGKGRMLDVPFRSAEGVYLPLTRKGQTFLEFVEPRAMLPFPGCSAL